MQLSQQTCRIKLLFFNLGHMDMSLPVESNEPFVTFTTNHLLRNIDIYHPCTHFPENLEQYSK